MLELFGSDADERPITKDVTVNTDGMARVVPAGEKLVLRPGESITLTPGLYHRFYGEPGAGTVLVGEVSTVNDDDNDNRFYDAGGRFPEFEEDEPPYRLLVKDYPSVLSAAT